MRIVLGNRISRLEAPTPILQFAAKVLRARSKDWFFQVKNRPGWDGWHNFINQGGWFATGLAARLQAALEKELNCRIPVVDGRRRPALTEKTRQLSFRDSFGKPYDLREEQCVALEAVLSTGGLTFHAATNSGKTDVAIALARAMGERRVIFFTHRRTIAHQTRKRAAEALGEPVGLIGDSEWTPRRVTVCMVQTLRDTILTTHPRFKEVRALLVGAAALVWDECHRSSSGDWWKVAQAISRWSAQEEDGGPYWSLAMSGTALAGDDLAIMRLEALAGPVGARITNAEQIAKGYSAEVHVCILNVPTIPGTERLDGVEARRAYYRHEGRNALIAGCARVMADYGLPCFLATENLQTHHPALLKAFSAAGVRVASITGEMPTAAREVSCQALREGRADLLLSTTVLDEGWDVPNVYGVFDAGTQSSDSATLQRLGRGIRRKEGLNHLLHFICGDWGNLSLADATRKRLDLLRAEEAFTFYTIDRPEQVAGLLDLLGFQPRAEAAAAPAEAVPASRLDDPTL